MYRHCVLKNIIFQGMKHVNSVGGSDLILFFGCMASLTNSSLFVKLTTKFDFLNSRREGGGSLEMVGMNSHASLFKFLKSN